LSKIFGATKILGVVVIIADEIMGVSELLGGTCKGCPLPKSTLRPRGVLHCVMHKCIMVKLGGKEKHIKYVKNA